MSDLFWLTDEQIERLRPFFPKSHGRPRVDDRRVLSGIVFVNRNGLRWRDAPSAYGPHKTLYNRWKRWGEAGVFTRMMEGLAAAGAEPKTVMIDATYLKAHRTASSLRVKRMARPVGKRFVSDVLSSLRKRIRPSNTRLLAKMEIRASWSS
ncbi:transposase [Sphingomonas sp. JUb134]|nr:transposase [Sphingomonas sp. JUb134]MBM7407296.1 transposase [Sphingomonas sp. JUb134]